MTLTDIVYELADECRLVLICDSCFSIQKAIIIPSPSISAIANYDDTLAYELTRGDLVVGGSRSIAPCQQTARLEIA